MSERGTSLLEATAALAVASILLTGAAEETRSAALALRRARAIAAASTAARNLLETGLGALCADASTARVGCPPPFRCASSAAELARYHGDGLLVRVVHLRATVYETPEARAPLADLSTVVRRLEPCPPP